LATSCANSLIALITTDSWEQVKRGVSKVFGRSEAAAGARAEEELTEARRELVIAAERNDDETAEEFRVAWRGKFRRLLLEDPEAAEILSSTLQEWQSVRSNADTSVNITQSATARESGRVYQQGSGTQVNY
jgi:hypothetical protein